VPTDDNRKRIMERLRPHKGFVFRWQPYKELAPDWDHDHCNGCWARFAERPGEWNDTVHTEGWVTLWPAKLTRQQEEETVAEWRAAGMRLVPSPTLGGFQLDWVCPECFETCRKELAFVIDSEHPQWQKAGL
jgi:hypothetical protein